MIILDGRVFPDDLIAVAFRHVEGVDLTSWVTSNILLIWFSEALD